MQRRYSLEHLILSVVIVLMLTLLMVCVETQAQIVFHSKRDGNWEIYVMDADGGNPRNLTKNRNDDTFPSWSPDGKRVAFVSDRDGHVMNGISTAEIYVIDADGDNPQNLTNNPGSDRDPSWSPDGKRIAFSSLRRDKDGNLGHFDIYVMDADGGNPRRLTENPHGARSPSWSPDGGRIVFSTRRDGHFRTKFGITSEIYVMDADGQGEQRLTENRQNDSYPVWSPDGERIAFASDRKGDLENYEIYVIDADGGNQQQLTNHRGDDGSPSWSPDGEQIAFHSLRGEQFRNAEIYVMDADGGGLQNLTNHPVSDAGPAWLNSPFSVSPAGKKFTIWGQLKQVDR